jgi:hypothetical protein
VSDILALLRHLAALPDGTPLDVYEEVKEEPDVMITPLEHDAPLGTPAAGLNQLESGDILTFQRAAPPSAVAAALARQDVRTNRSRQHRDAQGGGGGGGGLCVMEVEAPGAGGGDAAAAGAAAAGGVDKEDSSGAMDVELLSLEQRQEQQQHAGGVSAAGQQQADLQRQVVQQQQAAGAVPQQQQQQAAAGGGHPHAELLQCRFPCVVDFYHYVRDRRMVRACLWRR